MDIYTLLILFATGIAGGVISGMLGIGGGLIYVLIFSQFIQGFTDKPITGTDLVTLLIANSVFALVFAGLSGSWRQYRSGNFFWKPILLIAIPGILSSVLTTYLISTSGVYSKQEFAVFFSLIMLPIIARMIWYRQPTHTAEKPVNTFILLVVGTFSGMVTALSGLGGGFIIVPVLNTLFGMTMKKAVSISLGVIALVALFFSIYNLALPVFQPYHFYGSLGAIVFPLVIPVVLGVLLGAPRGVMISHKLPNYWHRIIFVVFTSIVIIRLLIQFL